MTGSMISPIAPMCGQCGKTHPPLPPGTTCPNAIVRSQGKVVEFEKIFIPLKTILKSQIETKQIKNIDKLFGYVIVKMTKLIEEYKE